MWRKKKSNLPFAHFGLQYRFERFLAIGRLWLHTSATNACTHCTAPASAATALSAYSSYCCSTQNDSSYSICITQGELLQQQHTSTTHATQQHSNTAPALLSAVTAFAATFPEATALRHSQGLHQQHTSATYATAAYIAPAHATTAFEVRFTAKTISQGSYHSSTQTIALHNIKTPSKTTAQVNNTCYNCVHTSNSTGSHISFSHSTLCHLLKQHPKR